MERDIASAKREIDRIVELLVQKGVMEEEDKLTRSRSPRQLAMQAQAALNELEPVDNVLVIHPGAIKKFSDQIKALRDHAAEMVGEDATEAAKAIRALIDKIIVHPHPEKKGGVRSRSREN